LSCHKRMPLTPLLKIYSDKVGTELQL